jgi:hypothetical protein
MTEIRKSKQYLVMEGLGHLILEFETCPLVPCVAGGFICKLVLGICDFRHKPPRQSHYL